MQGGLFEQRYVTSNYTSFKRKEKTDSVATLEKECQSLQRKLNQIARVFSYTN